MYIYSRIKKWLGNVLKVECIEPKTLAIIENFLTHIQLHVCMPTEQTSITVAIIKYFLIHIQSSQFV